MARIRSIHPGLATDEKFMSMSAYAMATWPLLWTECDDHGAFAWNPVVLKARLLPYPLVKMEDILAEWEQLGCIKKIEIGGKPVGLVRNFCKFQRCRRPQYIYAIPDEWRTFIGLSDADGIIIGTHGVEIAADDEGQDDDLDDTHTLETPIARTMSVTETVQGASRRTMSGISPHSRVGEGDSRVEEETTSLRSVVPPKARKVGSRLPETWIPSETDSAFARSQGLSEEASAREAAKFRDFWLAKSGRDGTKQDWSATWRNWVRKHCEMAGIRAPQPQANGHAPPDGPTPPADESIDRARLAAGRQRKMWSRPKWGPAPHEPGYLGNPTFLLPDDGRNWVEWRPGSG